MKSFIYQDLEMWGVVGSFPHPIPVTSFNAGFSNPKFDKISSYFSRFGYKKFKHDFSRTLGKDAKLIAEKIDQIVDTRNSIAHGDPLATRTPKEVLHMIQTSKLFFRNTDKVFSDWCKESIFYIQ